MKQIIAALFFGSLFFWSATANPRDGYLHITGMVLKNERPVSRATLRLLENDVEIYKLRSRRSGDFSMYVPFQKEYMLEVSAKNTITKRILINTQTDEPIISDKYYFYDFEVELFEITNCVTQQLFRHPVSIVFYDCELGNFNHYVNSLAMSMRQQPGVFRDSLGVAFDSPENYFRYLENIARERDQLHIIYPGMFTVEERELIRKAAIEEAIRQEVLAIQAEAAQQQPTPLHTREPQQHLQATPSRIEQQPVYREETVQTPLQTTHNHDDDRSAIIDGFFRYLQGKAPVVIDQNTFFSIQILATNRAVPEGFFNRIASELSAGNLLYYRDSDNLDKFSYGIFTSMAETLNTMRVIRDIGYESYIVAFHNGERIRVKQAEEILGGR